MSATRGLPGTLKRLKDTGSQKTVPDILSSALPLSSS
jgi:hypothetical protein